MGRWGGWWCRWCGVVGVWEFYINQKEMSGVVTRTSYLLLLRAVGGLKALISVRGPHRCYQCHCFISLGSGNALREPFQSGM